VESVAVVVVTHNRAALLERCLDGLAKLERRPDVVYVVDNASSDGTAALLGARTDLPLRVVRSDENLGGAGGFHLGVRTAYDDGHDRIWLMDDDVVPAPTSLTVLLQHPGLALTAVREDTEGRLCEKAAVHFDLSNPFHIRPKRGAVDDAYPDRASMPAEVRVGNVAFEGFLVHRRVLDVVGFPDPSFFIFYDDADFAVRTTRAGFPILALRDAVVVRQLGFDQQHDLRGWKGFYMYRNLFVVHFRYGTNPLVRVKPYLITAAAVVLSPWRGGRAEARNAVRALWSARQAPPPPQP